MIRKYGGWIVAAVVSIALIVTLIIVNNPNERPSFEAAVYEQALPYFYSSDREERIYTNFICNSLDENISIEYIIMGLPVLSGVQNTETNYNYIQLVSEYRC